MLSQMNVVQNAARLTMDHRAADPARRRGPAGSVGRLTVLFAVTAALGALLFWTVLA